MTSGLFDPGTSLNVVADIAVDPRFGLAVYARACARHWFDVYVVELKSWHDRFAAEGVDISPLAGLVRRLVNTCTGRQDYQQRAEMLSAAFPYVTLVPLSAPQIADIRNSPAWLNIEPEPPSVPYLYRGHLASIAREGERVYFGTFVESALRDMGLIEEWGFGEGDRFRWTHCRLTALGARAVAAGEATR